MWAAWQICFSKCSNQKKIVHLRGTITSLPSVPLQQDCLFLVICNRRIHPGTFAVEHACTHLNPGDLCENETTVMSTFPQLALTLFPWTDFFFFPRSSIVFMIVNIPRPNWPRDISPSVSLFHQQHSKPTCDVSSKLWQMRAHRSRYHSSVIGEPCPHADAGSLCTVATEIIFLVLLQPPGWVVWLFIPASPHIGEMRFACFLRVRGTGSI